MSLDPRLLSGNAGTIQDQINAGVIYQYWARSRAMFGEEVTLGALCSGYPDGTSGKLLIQLAGSAGSEQDEAPPVAEVEGSVDKGLIHGKWKIEFDELDEEGVQAKVYAFYFLVELEGELRSWRELSPELLLDMTLPVFSE